MRLSPVLWLVLPLLLACAHPTPEQTLRRYLEFLAAGRYKPAYRLTSAAFQARCDLLCFQRTVERNRGELAAALQQVRSRGAVRTEFTTEVATLTPTPLTLVRSGQRTKGAPEEWSIAGDPLQFYPQDTPERALRSFVRAAEARRFDVLLRFVPQSRKQQVTSDGLQKRWEAGTLRAQVQEVRRHLAEPLIVKGAEARLPLADKREARLLLEEGRWRVLQLQ